MQESKIDLHKSYRKMIFKDDPRMMLQLPKEVVEDLQKMAEYNARPIRAEIVARLSASLTHNEMMMAHDRTMQLIFNAGLAHNDKKQA